jgi:hypothetical protein
MSAASNYLENKVLDHVLGEGARTFTSPATIYLALFKETGTGTLANLEAGTLTDEISTSGTAYARQGVNFSAASSGTAATNGTVTWTTATADWGTVTAVAVVDSPTAQQATCCSMATLPPARPLPTVTHSRSVQPISQ